MTKSAPSINARFSHLVNAIVPRLTQANQRWFLVASTSLAIYKYILSSI